MKDYNWIKNCLEELTDDTYGGDKSVHASEISEELDNEVNDYARYMNYDIIACVAFKEGYNVYRVKHGYYGDDDYLLLRKGYTLEQYRKKWSYEMDDIDEVLEGAYKITSLDQIVKQD